MHSRRSSWLVSAAVAIAVLWASSTLLFFYRDNFSTHLPVKYLSAEIIRLGAVPLWNFNSGGGQPLAGNPNYLTFYPSTLLYLVLPPFIAFNLHFYIHLIGAFLAMRLLLRTIGHERGISNALAIFYLLTGTVLSTTTFYNLVCAAALVPLTIALLLRLAEAPTLRRAFEVGISCGLLGLAGEPIVVVGVVILGAVVMVGRIGARVWMLLGLSVFVAFVAALPQIIAYAEIAASTERGHFGYSSQTVLRASLQWWRIIEMILGPVFGQITNPTPTGLRASLPGVQEVFFISLFIGAVTIPALLQVTDRLSRRFQIGAALLFFLALGSENPVVRGMIEAAPSLRFARFPEKFILHFTVAITVLAATLISKEHYSRWDRVALWALSIPFAGAIAAAFMGDFNGLTRWRLLAGGVICVALLGSSYIGQRVARQRWQTIVLLVPLLYWLPKTVLLAPTRSFVSAATATSSPFAGYRVWRPAERETSEFTGTTLAGQFIDRASMVDPMFGAIFGVRYALSRSPEGMSSWLSRIIWERTASVSPDLRLRYARLAGCDYIVMKVRADSPAIPRVGEIRVGSNLLHVYRVTNRRPDAYAATRIHIVGSVNEAVNLIESANFDEQRDVIVPSSIRNAPHGAATTRSFSRESNGLRFRVLSTEGATIIVNESYFSSWRATSAGHELTTFPANIDRLGVIVPAGDREVELQFGRKRPLLYLAIAFSLLTLCGPLFFVVRDRIRSKKASAEPAR